jgi:hypothetical protein
VALALVLAVVGAALSATASTQYRGKTKQGPKVSFHTTATSVVGFKTSVSVPCSSATTGNRLTDIRPVSLPKSPLKNGRFKITFKIPTNALVIIAKGTAKGGSASGFVDVRYTKIIGTTSTGLMDIAGCYAKTTWTAKQI